MKVSLCLMVWNELQGCKIDVPLLPKEEFYEIYAVDGGSNDGTVEYLESQGIPVYRQPVKSLNAAYHFAVEKTSSEAVVVFFPKGTIEPNEALKALPFLRQGCDLVVASRNISGAYNEEDEQFLKPRKWLVSALSWLAALIWQRDGYRIRDVLHGFKGFTVTGFKAMSPSCEGVSIDIEMVVRSYRLRLPRAEFPTVELPRNYGSSHFPIFNTGMKLLKYLIKELRVSRKEIMSLGYRTH